ncbi:hypothetical protein AJ85_15460 [Alkalihalobacillus alcalophilus ATCC 27647 = CGMCC 1.3604]|uniref:DUF3898 domain-containing protein n=1 Tax=Alkalihalobacillus alcalophilus ATCC 27647 = CGMCC 1.3604 TaxID=1218173 RepID=A0A094WG11_ALKAL|nr:DUF3900 domain-containing protein [Alkalihalobacillus alcalophilus]KGA95711.1 hypothetical protein BALCAV_0220800 [Alkalihalobacillus alcalophilus ATCC 27647 = CGMCC 1.3604]MED1564109.1 DUF3900 domain-containing protein [Alkalihalobacillus alcalophilus]THG89726.1 hypothetical protein AJ85_15460 [Alkalihalobacillus alcalophilus ATCC 27647 = CGMCC 1.3604]
MDFEIQFLSFYVVQIDGQGEQTNKLYKHFQTLNKAEFEQSQLKDFLDGELKKIVNRKVERHPKSDQVPTKIGRFVTEPGHELTSNPNYNLFYRARTAESKMDFQEVSEKFVRIYLETSAVRGGAFLVATAVPRKFYDDAFVFIMKCDFEPKVATISDEASLIRKVEHAITTKNMKSIQYPFMPEEGMIEEAEVKIHQASHARYFEDFLKYVEYGDAMPTIIKSQVLNIVQEHVTESFSDNREERQKFEHELEIWEASEKREISERLDTHQVMEASAHIVEQTPEAEIKMKLGETEIKALLADFGETLHLAKLNGRYVLLVEAEAIQFEKGVSPVEFYKPDDLHEIIEKINRKG